MVEKSREHLIHELQFLREKVAKLEKSQALRRDILKKSEQALQLSEEKFSKAFHCNPDPVSICKFEDGCYVEVNQAYEELTGFERKDIIGKTALDLGILVNPEEVIEKYRFIRDHGFIPSFETKFINKAGKTHTYLLSMEIIELDGIQHFLNLCKDITERKRVESALQLSEECFSKAFNASPIANCLTTFQDGRIIKVNASFCRIFGFSFNSILGRTLRELDIFADPDQRQQIKEIIRINDSVNEVEINFRRTNGEIWLGLYSAEKVDINGELCILSLVTDLTAKKQIEIEMRRLDQLNLIGDMAVSIGHEIRNPMTTVRGYLQLLNDKKEYLQEEETIELMIEELDRANNIISEFLSLAKNKMMELKLSSLNSILKTIYPLLQSNAVNQGKNIMLEMGELPALLLDENEIRQLIFNLVNNGLESIPEGKNVKIKTYLENGHVVLAVCDEGIGIDREIIEKLGTPFFTTKEKGTGLGLAVCYGIASRHNAKIDIESNTNGTTFYVRLKPSNP